MRLKSHSNRHKRIRGLARLAAPLAEEQIRAKGIELPEDKRVRLYSEKNQRKLQGRQLLGGLLWIPWEGITRTMKLEIPMIRIITRRLKRSAGVWR